MEIDADLAKQALDTALAASPRFAEFGPRIAYRALFQGGTYLVEFAAQPPKDIPGVWDFQNAAVKGYKKLKGV